MPTLYKTDGTQEEVNPSNGKNFTLDELYKLLDCDTIEVIYLQEETKPKDLIMIGDEESGLFGQLPHPQGVGFPR